MVKKTKTRPMFVSENFHKVVYKWGINNDLGRSAGKITDAIAKKLEDEIRDEKRKKEKIIRW